MITQEVSEFVEDFLFRNAWEGEDGTVWVKETVELDPDDLQTMCEYLIKEWEENQQWGRMK